MYELGQYVIYGNNGVCSIDAIGSAPLPELNQDRTYYTLTPIYEKLQMHVPVDTDAFMRPIMGQEEIHTLILKYPEIEAPIISTSNSTELATEYRKMLATHESIDLLRLIKSITMKNRKAEKEGRRMGLTDSRFLKQAEDLLYGEFSISLNLSKEEMEQYILDYLAEQGMPFDLDEHIERTTRRAKEKADKKAEAEARGEAGNDKASKAKSTKKPAAKKTKKDSPKTSEKAVSKTTTTKKTAPKAEQSAKTTKTKAETSSQTKEEKTKAKKPKAEKTSKKDSKKTSDK